MSDPSAADATSSAECPTIMPLCSACGQTMGKRQFSQNQLTKGDRARCKSCVNSGTASTVAQSQGFVAPQAGDHTITRSATGGVTLTGDMSHEAISAFCTAAGWMEGDHASGEAKVAAGAVAQPETPRFVFRGLRANEKRNALRRHEPTTRRALGRPLARKPQLICADGLHATCGPRFPRYLCLSSGAELTPASVNPGMPSARTHPPTAGSALQCQRCAVSYALCPPCSR